MRTTCCVTHSKVTGLSAGRGARTRRPGTGVSPASSNSLSPWASASAHATTRATFDSVATLTVNAPVPPSASGFALRSVSFSPAPPGGLATLTTRPIGSLPTPVKKLKGARFGRPAASHVPTTAIGRGTIAPIISA